MGRYLVSDNAAADLANIEDRYLERGGSQENADVLILGFLESFQNLADFPDIGTQRDYLKDDELAVPHGDYIIVFLQESEGLISILHVIWGRMDLFNYFSDD